MEVSEIIEQQLKIAWERLDAAKYLFDGEPEPRKLFDVFDLRFGKPQRTRRGQKREITTLRVLCALCGLIFLTMTRFSGRVKRCMHSRTTREPEFLKRVRGLIEKIKEGATGG